MSDEVPSGRLSQIFDSLTNLQQQQQQQLQQHQQKPQQLKQQRPRSTSSSPSPVGSGRATPSGGTHVHVQQHLSSFQQHSHNFYLRHATDSYFVPSGTQTFPSATSQTHHHHLLPAHYYQQHHHHHQQQQQHFLCQQQQQSSLPPLLYDTQSLNTSPLLSKRATSFSGNMPLVRGESHGSANATTSQIRCSHVAAATAALTSQSTPNSPRLMPRRTQRAPPIPAKPNAAQLAAAATPLTAVATLPAAAPTSQSTQNPALAALDTDAPWPHFSALTEHLDVHQLNNYSHAVPEINWQERCLELQLELHRSKNQAGRIRDMLRDKLEAQQKHLRKNSNSPPLATTSATSVATVGSNNTHNNSNKQANTKKQPGQLQQQQQQLTTSTLDAAAVAACSNKLLSHASSSSNGSSAASSPSKVMAAAAAYHQHQQQQHHHHHHPQQQQQHLHNNHHQHHLLQHQHQHQHPVVASLKQCAAVPAGAGTASGLGGVGVTLGCCNNSCLSGSTTPPTIGTLHHGLGLYALAGHCYSSGPSSLVNSPALGRRKRYTSTSSNCSSQFNNNYAGLDMESLDEMLRKVSVKIIFQGSQKIVTGRK